MRPRRLQRVMCGRGGSRSTAIKAAALWNSTPLRGWNPQVASLSIRVNMMTGKDRICAAHPFSPMPLMPAYQRFKIPARSQSTHRPLLHPLNSAEFRRGGLKADPNFASCWAPSTYCIWNCDPMRPNATQCDPMRPHAAPCGPMRPHAALCGPPRVPATPRQLQYILNTKGGTLWQGPSLRRGPKAHQAPTAFCIPIATPLGPPRIPATPRQLQYILNTKVGPVLQGPSQPPKAGICPPKSREPVGLHEFHKTHSA